MFDKIASDFIDVSKKLEHWLESFLVYQIPFRIPIEVREIGVKIMPYIALFLIIQHVPTLTSTLSGVGLGWLSLSHMKFVTVPITDVIFSICSVVFLARSVLPLFHRQYQGWVFLYYTWLVYVVYQGIFGSIIASLGLLLMSAYFLFQLKSEYR